MVRLRRIGIRSTILTTFWLSVALGFAQVVLVVIAAVVMGVPVNRFDLIFWIQVAIGLLLFGLNNAFMMGILVFLYNLVSNTIGGIYLEFETVDTPTQKPKNGETEHDTRLDDDAGQ